MWPYYILVMYIFIVVGFCKPKIGDKNYWKYFLLIIPLFFFAALRGNGNGDYFVYLNRGEQIKTFKAAITDKTVGMEIGYRILSFIVFKMRLPRQFTLIFMNVISLTCISLFIIRYSKDWPVSLLLYLPLFFQFDMHATRTAVAIGICAVGYKYVKERNLIKYFICVALACAFHSAALVSIIAFFLYNKKINSGIGGIILGLEIVIVRCISIVEILKIFLTKLHFDYFLQKLVTYSTTKADLYGYALNLYDVRIWIGICIFFVAKTFVCCKKRSDENFMINSIFMYAFLLILFSSNTFFAYRLSAFFYIYLATLVPDIIMNCVPVQSPFIDGRIPRVRMFYCCIMFFTAWNLAYAMTMVEYISIFKSGYGLMPY